MDSRLAGVAQLVEHLICNQRVGGSNPFASSRLRRFAGVVEPRTGEQVPAAEILNQAKDLGFGRRQVDLQAGGGQLFQQHSIREFPDELLARMSSHTRVSDPQMAVA